MTPVSTEGIILKVLRVYRYRTVVLRIHKVSELKYSEVHGCGLEGCVHKCGLEGGVADETEHTEDERSVVSGSCRVR